MNVNPTSPPSVVAYLHMFKVSNFEIANSLWGHLNSRDAKYMKNAIQLLLFFFCQYYATWLVIGVLLQQCMQFVGHLFHQPFVQLLPQCCSLPLVVLPTAILASMEVFTELEALVRFVPNVYNRMHVMRLWTPWRYCDCVITEPFDCWPIGMFWVVIIFEHPLLHFFFQTSHLTCSSCHVRCSYDVCYSIFLQFWSAPQLPPNYRNTKAYSSPGKPIFIYFEKIRFASQKTEFLNLCCLAKKINKNDLKWLRKNKTLQKLIYSILFF